MGELEPNGIDRHEPGAKMDAGKPRIDLVLDGFSRALLAIVRAHQGLKTNEVAKLSHHERSLTLLLLKELEASKQVRNTGSAKVARWEAV